jgi:hypothetical protein
MCIGCVLPQFCDAVGVVVTDVTTGVIVVLVVVAAGAWLLVRPPLNMLLVLICCVEEEGERCCWETLVALVLAPAPVPGTAVAGAVVPVGATLTEVREAVRRGDWVGLLLARDVDDGGDIIVDVDAAVVGTRGVKEEEEEEELPEGFRKPTRFAQLRRATCTFPAAAVIAFFDAAVAFLFHRDWTNNSNSSTIPMPRSTWSRTLELLYWGEGGAFTCMKHDGVVAGFRPADPTKGERASGRAAAAAKEEGDGFITSVLGLTYTGLSGLFVQGDEAKAGGRGGSGLSTSRWVIRYVDTKKVN